MFVSRILLLSIRLLIREIYATTSHLFILHILVLLIPEPPGDVTTCCGNHSIPLILTDNTNFVLTRFQGPSVWEKLLATMWTPDAHLYILSVHHILEL